MCGSEKSSMDAMWIKVKQETIGGEEESAGQAASA